MPTVPFLELKLQNSLIWDQIHGEFGDLVSQAQFILGPAVKGFEESFARYCGARYCVGLNNGTTALHMALLAFNIGPGDEVITTPHSWISTSWGIAYTGAKPVYADIDRQSYNLDPQLVEAAVTPRTKAVLPVHLYGQAADMSALRQICDRHGLVLIEDAAQAHGAQHAGQVVGSLGDAACFSFYPGKNLGAFGESGCVTTNSDAVAERIRCLRDHAQAGRHNHVEIGYNTRMEGIQGLVLQRKLAHLPQWTQQRRQHAQFYLNELRDIPGLALPSSADPDSHVWHLFVVLVPDRERFRAALEAAGVATGVHYPVPIPYQPAFAHLGYCRGSFPVTEDVMNRCVSLPMYPELTEAQLRHVVQSVRTAMSGA
jgi:dTDP-4-amino-4,6-dideoxygalactose transaminase